MLLENLEGVLKDVFSTWYAERIEFFRSEIDKIQEIAVENGFFLEKA